MPTSEIQQLIDMGIRLPINVPNYFGMSGTIRFPRQLDKISLKYDNVLNEFVSHLQDLVRPNELFMIVRTPENFTAAWDAFKRANELCHTLEQDSEEFTALFEGLRYCLDGFDYTLNEMATDEPDPFKALQAVGLAEAQQYILDFFADNERPTDDRLTALEIYPEQK